MKRSLIIVLFFCAFQLKAQHVRSRIDTLHCNLWFETGKVTDTIWGGYMLSFKTGSWSNPYTKDTIVFTDRKFLRLPNRIIGYKAIPK